MADITVNGKKVIRCSEGESLMSALCSAGYAFPGNCGGRGQCRRCMVYDEKNGEYVRSCMTEVRGDMRVRLAAAGVNVLADYVPNGGRYGEDEYRETLREAYSVAVDLGTTTVAMELICLADGSQAGLYTFMNPQIEYGSDVISRIKVGSDASGLEELRKPIADRLRVGIAEMLSRIHADYATPSDFMLQDMIKTMVISGNTTMLSIVCGLTLENLGYAPFEIKNPKAVIMDGGEFFEDESFDGIRIVCPGNLSAFVGADALGGALVAIGDDFGTSGCAHADYSDKQPKNSKNQCEYSLFIDMGTNGELILSDGVSGYATSCACGPAFEGMFRRGAGYGSDAFDMICMLRRLGKLDEQGVLADEYIENGCPVGGGMVIDMDIIREFLLAKAAIGAGIETLLSIAQVKAADVKNVYIAGGFGCSLNMDSALALGLFPQSFAGRLRYMGNTSLAGARSYLTDGTFAGRLEEFTRGLVPVNLADSEGFDRCYYRHMNLKPWTCT